MATARMSIGSIFSAVGETAKTLTTTLGAINEGVGMANEAITNMAIQQKLRSKADNASFKITLANEKSQELAESTLDAAKFRGQSDAHASAFDEAHKVIAAALEAK